MKRNTDWHAARDAAMLDRTGFHNDVE